LSRNLGASTSWNPQGLSRPAMGLLYLLHQKIGMFTASALKKLHLTIDQHE